MRRVVDAGEEVQQFPGAGAGRADALLVVAECLQGQFQVALQFVFADLGEQPGLGAAGPVCVAFGGCDRYVLQVQFCGKQAAGPVGELDGQGPAQRPQRGRRPGDRGQAEPLAGRAVHPVAEGAVPAVEGEPPEQQRSGPAVLAGRVVAAAGREAGGDRAARCTSAMTTHSSGVPPCGWSLDHPPGEPVAGQPRRGLAGRQRGSRWSVPSARRPACPYTAAMTSRHAVRATSVGGRPRMRAWAASTGRGRSPSAMGMRAAARPHGAAAPTRARVLPAPGGGRQPGPVEAASPASGCDLAEADGQQRVARVPAGVRAARGRAGWPAAAAGRPAAP